MTVLERTGRTGTPALALLAFGAPICVILSLSVHVVMLQILHIPYPAMTTNPGRIAMLYPFSQVLGAVLLTGMLAANRPHWAAARLWVVLGTLFSALNGVVRGALMEGVTTTGYIARAASLAEQLAINFALAGAVVALTRQMRRPALQAIAAVALTALLIFAIQPLIHTVFAPLRDWASAYARPEAYRMPYGPNVLVPSYVSFLETVSACLAVAFLAGRNGPLLRSLARHAGIILLVRGSLIAMFVFGPLSGATAAAGLLSMSQFFLQDFVLVFTTFGLACLAMRAA
ncbi:hypothetical protein HZF05_07240 [Sphingomonas sp. CGMCC 1.13654]|uniref:Uncharacterized protein n=1 Tax=Sphingomonas chungangi TaxID=2683589 RepID=A0A838L323_9SPHN|nr:hypothetical protein [Sphingomonas chungangi]MBA2933893.1 hypothetical protein [Sphingomonas chungangi]MVW55222.1 hypothetical protein [Sphingomonas chungangi]